MSGVAIATREQGAQDGIERALNLVGMLEQRSPGERTGAELTKHAQAAAPRSRRRPGGEDVERALGKDFPPEAISEVTEDLGLASPEQLLALADPGGVKDFVPAPAAANRGGGSFPTLVAFGGGGGSPSKPGGGGGNGGGGEQTPSGETGETGNPPPAPPPPDIEIPPAVPEPGTWAMMLVGMGLCGFGLRRRARRDVHDAGRLCADA